MLPIEKKNNNYACNLKYENELLKKLDAFKSALEWSDLVGLLGGIDKTFEKYNPGYIAHLNLLVKRLSQCLNPMLPTGVHLKTLETYTIIFESITQEEFYENYTALTMNLFTFGLNCRIVVTSEYISLIREHIIPHLGNVPSEGVILALLPTLESESSEFFEETYEHLVQVRERIGTDEFFEGVFKVYIEYSELQGSVANMLGRMKIGRLRSYKTATRALCEGLRSEKMHVVRSVLDMTGRDFPIGNGGEEWKEDLLACNARLIQNVLVLFLRKEAGINKRVYKWFEATEEVDEKGIGYFERGMRRFLNKNEMDLLMFYKIIYALSDKENLANVLINNLMLQSLKYLMIVNEKENIKYSKFNKILGSIGIDYIWRIFYEKMKELFGKCTNENNKESGPIGAVRTIGENEMPTPDQSMLDAPIHSAGGFPEVNISMLFEIIFFSIKNLKIINTNARTIHLPLLANVIARNRHKTNSDQFFKFFSIFIGHSEYREGVVCPRSIDDMADRAYAKETFTTIAGLNIHKHIGKELASSIHYGRTTGKPEIERLLNGNQHKYYYDGMAVDLSADQSGQFFEIKLDGKNYRCYSHEHDDTSISVAKPNCDYLDNLKFNSTDNLNLIDDNPVGTHLGNNSTDGFKFYNSTRNSVSGGLSPHFHRICDTDYFTKNDCAIFQSFIEKYGLSIFPDEFYGRLGRFLTKNYYFLRLAELVRPYICNETLLTNIWNDFVVYKNPIFVVLYDLNNILVRNMQLVRKDDLYRLLIFSTNMPHTSPLQNYFDLLFCVSSKSGDSIEFSNLVLGINNPQHLLEYCLEKILHGRIERQNEVYMECPEFNKLNVSLDIISKLIGNVECQSLLREDTQATSDDIRKHLGNTLLQALNCMLEILLETENDPTEEDEIDRMEIGNGSEEMTVQKTIRMINGKIKATNISDDLQINLCDLIDHSDFNVIYKQSNNSNNEIIQKKAFGIYHCLRKLGMPIEFQHVEAIKKTIRKFSKDFTILRWAFPIVATDYAFVIDTYARFYRETFPLVESGNRPAFFDQLIARPEKLRLRDLREVTRYFEYASNELFYKTVMDTLARGSKYEMEECLCALADLLWTTNPGLFNKVFCTQCDKRAILRLMNKKTELVNAVIKEGKLELARKLCRELAKKQRIELFERSYLWLKHKINSKRDYEIFLFAIELIVDEEDLQRYEREAKDLMRSGESVGPKPDDLFKYEKQEGNPAEPKTFDLLKYARLDDLINATNNNFCDSRSNSFIRNAGHNSNSISLNTNTTNSNGTMRFIGKSFISGIQETIKAVGISADKLSFVLSSILSSLNFHISSAIKLDISFVTELEILQKIFYIIIEKPDIIEHFCKILFVLLSSPKYHSQAFALIFATIIKFPKSMLFAEAFLNYFNDTFFTTRIYEKKIILHIISQAQYSQLDKVRSDEPIYGAKILTPLLIRLFNNLEGSYFLSQYNNLLQKTHALRRLSFLLLANHSNFFEIENKLVTAVSTLILDDMFVKGELYRLATIMLFRFNHMSLIHLFPILISDFLQFLVTPTKVPLRFITNMFTCIDAWIWSGNTVSNMKFLFEDPRFVSKISIVLDLHYNGPSCLYNNPHYASYKAGAITSCENHKYMPLLLFPKTQNDFMEYLNEAPGFYRWAINNFLERDVASYDKYLLNTFCMEE